MDYLELQQRANQIVSKVNNYEAGLAKYEITEADILAEHKYADLYTLRAVMNLLFGSTVDQKCDRSLNIPTDLRLFASTVPMWNTTFNLIPKEISAFNFISSMTVVGNPANSKGIISNLSDDVNYIYISSNNYPSSIINKVVLKITIPNKTSGYEVLWSDDYSDIDIRLHYYSGYAQLYAYSRYYSSNLSENTQYRLTPGSTYYIQGHRILNSTSIDYKISTDGITYTSWQSDNARPGYPGNKIVGVLGDNNSSQSTLNFSGSIDFTSSYYIVGSNIDESKNYFMIEDLTGDYDYEVKSDKHEFISDIDALNNYNLIHLDALENTVTSRDQRIKQGINYSYSSNIADALVTESQVANMFNWNTTDPNTIPNNTLTLNRQVPGIVVYTVGPDYDKFYTSTIGYNPTQSKFNAVNYGNPSTYGSYYRNDDVQYSQYSHETPTFASEFASCKVFMTGMNYTRGKLESPQQIWQPAERYGDDNIGYGYNRQGQATYHELVFKNRRIGSGASNLDFTPARSDIPDNDPQGLALRSVLAQQKDFYKGRPWFKELDSLYGANMSKFAANINQASKTGSGTGSFDRGKFNLVGSPTLSDTGILSNFSTDNYITVDLPPINTNSEVEITLPKFNFTSSQTSSEYSPVFGFLRNTAATGFAIYNLQSFDTEGYASYITFRNATADFGTSFVDLIKNQGSIIIRNNVVYIAVGGTENSLGELISDTTLPTTLYICKTDPSVTTDTIDLSPLRIVVDGVEVFTAKATGETYMTDQDFYANYKLSYDTYAESLNQPK